MKTITARCSCGAVHLQATGQPDRVGLCHRTGCKRAHGAMFCAAAIFPAAAVSIHGNTRDQRGRHFCLICSAPVFARSGEEVEIHLGALDDADAFVTSYECWVKRRAPLLAPIEDAAQFDRDRQI